MKIERRYALTAGDPYKGLKFRKFDCALRTATGDIVFEAKDIEAPDRWSQTAVEILAQKYLRRTGVPAATKRVAEKGVPEFLQRSMPDVAALAKRPAEHRFGRETSARQVFDRLAGASTSAAISVVNSSEPMVRKLIFPS